MSPLHGRKKLIVILSGVALAVVAAVAYSYWTTTGAGTGSETSAAGNNAVTVTQSSVVTGMYPGGPAQPVNFTIANPGPSKQYIAAVAVSISAVTGPNITGPRPCAAADFTLVQPNAIGQDLAVGDTAFAPSGASLKMIDSATNQDGCKGSTVTLAFAAS